MNFDQVWRPKPEGCAGVLVNFRAKALQFLDVFTLHLHMSAANTLTPSPNVLAVGSRHQPQYYVSDTDGSDDDILPTSSRVLWKKARMNARAATAASGSDHPSSSTEEKLQDRKSCKAASQCRYYQRYD